MHGNLFGRRRTLRYRSHVVTLIGFAVRLTLLTIGLGWPVAFAQPAESTQNAEIGGVKFSIPKGFVLEQPIPDSTAFMESRTRETALFVAVPGTQAIDDKYLTKLSSGLVSRFAPRQDGFTWKILQRPSARPVSSYQTNGATTKGLSGNTFVQIDFVVVKAQGHEVVIGSIASFGAPQEAKYLFEVDGREYSVQAWEGLFGLTASVTGEKHVKEGRH